MSWVGTRLGDYTGEKLGGADNQRRSHNPWNHDGSGWHGPLDDDFPLQAGGELHFHDDSRSVGLGTFREAALSRESPTVALRRAASTSTFLSNCNLTC